MTQKGLWTGVLPKGWKISRIKWLVDPVDPLFTDGDWIEAPYITSDGVRLLQTGNIGIGEFREQGFRFISEQTFAELQCTEVLPNDILICRLADPVGRACLAPSTLGRMITSVDVAILRPQHDVDRRYYVYVFSSQRYLDWLAVICRGSTRDRISRRMLGDISVPQPPPDEQRAIADFLDRETSSIDDLIGTKKRLISAVADQRAALITTRVFGQDLSGTRKESGNRYMPSVPERWDIVPLRRCITISEGQVDPEDPRYKDLVLVAPNHIESGTGRILYAETAAEQAAISGKYQVRAGDLIYSKIRPALNKVCIANADCLCSADMYPVSPRPGMRSNYLFYVMLSTPFVQLVTDESMRVAMPKVNRPTLMSIRVPRPSLPEQEAIAEVLLRGLSELTALSEKTERSIEKLEEYRVALISGAVTGHIDVRNYCPKEAAAVCQ